MADQEGEDLRMALRMSLHSPPEAKRSKPRENVVVPAVSKSPEESPEAKNRKLQRELMAAAAEKRMMMAKSTAVTKAEGKKVSVSVADKSGSVSVAENNVDVHMIEKNVDVPMVEKSNIAGPVSEKSKTVFQGGEWKALNLGEELSPEDAKQLFSMVFGDGVSKEILAQWSNQGIRFSSDPETCMGLVQHEGGPCGVLATIQAYVLKHLLFFPDELGKNTANFPSQTLGPRRFSQSECVALGNFASLTEDGKARALVQSMAEILFLCGSKKKAVVATLNVFSSHASKEGSADGQNDDIIAKSLEGLPFESASDLQKALRISTHTSHASAFQHLESVIPVFQSRLGAMLFLISALLSRGLGYVQEDRDDPTLPLVTAPFGHASQAVANVFDGSMDLGSGMFLKGIPTSVEVGFLTLLESLNFCKVGQHLKCPKWPIWVVGSESHYTVLFSLNTSVQDENELEERESQIRKAFDAQDHSGGGGFVSPEGFHQVLRETGINLPQEKVNQLCSMGFIVWSEFWQALLELDRNLGGLKDSSGLMGKKVFDLYHFNGIAKSVLNGNLTTSEGESPLQRPRLSKLMVSVPPRWTPQEFMADVVPSSSSGDASSGKDAVIEVPKAEPPQHAPLVDCIRTRWPRAICNWSGDPPSIV